MREKHCTTADEYTKSARKIVVANLDQTTPSTTEQPGRSNPNVVKLDGAHSTEYVPGNHPAKSSQTKGDIWSPIKSKLNKSPQLSIPKNKTRGPRPTRVLSILLQQRQLEDPRANKKLGRKSGDLKKGPKIKNENGTKKDPKETT